MFIKRLLGHGETILMGIVRSFQGRGIQLYVLYSTHTQESPWAFRTSPFTAGLEHGKIANDDDRDIIAV